MRLRRVNSSPSHTSIEHRGRWDRVPSSLSWVYMSYVLDCPTPVKVLSVRTFLAKFIR